MSVNIETVIKYMYDLRARGIRYSMTGSRTGKDGTGDCSGTIYQGLRNGGATNAGWVLNTDSMHSWLVKNGFDLIAQNKEWTAKRGDIVIFGLKGQSGGAAGHVVIFISNTQIIHCTYKSATANGVYVDNEATTCPYDMGWYVYRQKGSNKPTTSKTIEQLAQEVLQGLHGNGEARKKSLGSNYAAVQKRVDALASSRKKSINTIAKEVINGTWGNGDARINKLKAAGYDPVAVQKRVNQLI
ncbi:C40 family peptidase [Enterococcus saccharolyticus]|uniref:peptidoglycan amidohydrolase family protein n=1 Tax=Enterococcus saccharolyticus TaxID=41997 RepID=UPI001E3F69C8|nr:peptidoglycan amidohydrolase family protein [Enterococcus saccharolyticus]MCD5001170.1 C40 family peptidase [Enterococcus saccharolyticus]